MTKKTTAPVLSGASSAKKPAVKKPVVKKVTSEKIVDPIKEEPVTEIPPVDPAPETEEIQAENTSAPAPEMEEIQAENISAPSPHFGPVIVIPFRANKAKGKELLYAIRAWEKHLPDVRIILIGNTLPELTGLVGHIPHKPVSDNPQIDVANKMAAAIASDLVPEVFIWSNDDIYCVSDIHPADLAVLKAVPGGLVMKGAGSGIYGENGARTLKALKDEGIAKPFDYAAHTPVVFEKTKLAETLVKFKCTKEGHLVSSLYFNTHYPNVRPVILDNTGQGSVVASVFRENPNPKVMPTIFATQKWVNNNDKGWAAVEPFLAKLFPTKSAFEK